MCLEGRGTFFRSGCCVYANWECPPPSLPWHSHTYTQHVGLCTLILKSTLLRFSGSMHVNGFTTVQCTQANTHTTDIPASCLSVNLSALYSYRKCVFKHLNICGFTLSWYEWSLWLIFSMCVSTGVPAYIWVCTAFWKPISTSGKKKKWNGNYISHKCDQCNVISFSCTFKPLTINFKKKTLTWAQTFLQNWDPGQWNEREKKKTRSRNAFFFLSWASFNRTTTFLECCVMHKMLQKTQT